MSDETANPEPGADRVGPDGPPVTTEDQAVASISAFLNNDAAPPKPEAQVEPEEAEEETEAEQEQPAEAQPEEEAEEEQPSQDEETEAEPEEADAEELSELTLPELAEALDVPADELASKLQVTVKVDGEEKTVTLADAIKGHQFEADYRQKTARLSEERKAFETEREQDKERLTHTLNQTAQLAQFLEQKVVGEEQALQRLIDPNSPDYNPEEFYRQKHALDQNKAALEQAKQHLGQQWKQHQEEQQKALNDYRAEQQQKLAEKMPVLADPAKGPQRERELAGFLEGQGYSKEEIETFFKGGFDHRQVLILDAAEKYHAMTKGQPVKKKLKGKPPVTKPGQSKGKPSDADKVASVRDRLRKARSSGDKETQRALATELVASRL